MGDLEQDGGGGEAPAVRIILQTVAALSQPPVAPNVGPTRPPESHRSCRLSPQSTMVEMSPARPGDDPTTVG
jgi:hypothetical protein